MPDEAEIELETSMRKSWSIGPLRPWLRMLAERQLPQNLRGQIDASDIVQQTLVAAWKGQSGYRGQTQAERMAWLRTILTRVILRTGRDHLQTIKRGEGREQLMQDAIDRESGLLEQLAADKNPGPSSQAQQSEHALLLAAALERLPDAYRQVLILRHLDGLSHNEIAAQIGRSVPATRMLWVRALECLRKEFSQED